MNTFENAKWIWYTDNAEADSYAEFRDKLTFNGGIAEIKISCDRDYTLFVNGYYAASGQYGDFEHYKIYDTVDITRFLNNGENDIEILVHYFGADSQRYRTAAAGLIYEISVGGEVVAYSSESVESRKSLTYVSGNKRKVSGQLGFGFSYDATKEEDKSGFAPSVKVEKHCTFFPRPIKKHDVLPRTPMKSVRSIDDDENHLLIDLGGEAVGLPVLELVTEKAQKITVAWGEHIDDGRVRMILGGRNFYYEYNAVAGHNDFTNYMLRLGCRYIEVITEAPVKLIYAGVLPQEYDIAERPVAISDELDRRIYEVCVNTLCKCMMEHYVDCPWREQCLYAFDSRNQMLCGYYAFEGGNAEYARSNLKLLGEDRRGDGLLSICAPCGGELAIPSFSLYYLMEMKEYLVHTGDVSLACEMIPKMKGILDEFIARYRDGLIWTFEGINMWNFYDWTTFASGSLRKAQAAEPDIFINSLFVISLDNFKFMCEKAGVEYPYDEGFADAIRHRMKEVFFDKCGLFSAREGAEQYTVLGNTLAILAGVITGDEAEALCDKIVRGEQDMIDCSLSMKVLEYEALLSVCIEKYRDFVLSDIRRNYKMMLDYGHDTFWETIKGASDFSNAGSLCHGWSAVPIYIFHRLGIAE